MVGLIGLFGGFFGGLLGIGGSFLVIPFLIGVVGLSHHKAHATALPLAFVAGLASLGFYMKHNHFNILIGTEVLVGSLVGVLVGTRLTRVIRGNWLSIGFGIFLFLIALVFMIYDPQDYEAVGAGNAPLLATVSLGVLAGVASGLFGAGGGTILVPGAVMFLHLTEQAAQGISLFVIIPTTLLGAISHYKEGNLSIPHVPPLMISAFAGGIFGGYLAVHVHSSVLRWLLVIVLLYIGARNVYNYGLKNLTLTSLKRGEKNS
jgi:hypothetical protein